MDVWNQESCDNIGAAVKKKNPVVIGGFLFGISLSVAVLFFLVKYFLPEDVEFRMWLRILWTVWIYLWAPFTFFVFLLCCIWGVRRQRENRRASASCHHIFLQYLYRKRGEFWGRDPADKPHADAFRIYRSLLLYR